MDNCTNTVVLKHGIIAILHHCELCSTCCNSESAPQYSHNKYYSWCAPTNQLLNRLVVILLQFKLCSKRFECRTAYLCCTHCTVLQTTQTVWSSHNIFCVPQYYNMHKSDSNDTPLTQAACHTHAYLILAWNTQKHHVHHYAEMQHFGPVEVRNAI